MRSFVQRHLLTLRTCLRTLQFVPVPAPADPRRPKLRYGVVIALGTWLYIGLETAGWNLLLY